MKEKKELYIPTLGNGVGLLMTVIIISVVLLVYRKRLSEVKRLREFVKFSLLGRALSQAAATILPPPALVPAMSFPWEYGGQRIQILQNQNSVHY